MIRSALLASAFLVAAESALACLPRLEGKAIWSPDRIDGDCIFVIYDPGPGRAFGFAYNKALTWDPGPGRAFGFAYNKALTWENPYPVTQVGTDGSTRMVQTFRIDAECDPRLATEQQGYRTPFSDIFNYDRIRDRMPFRKWLPDGRLWMEITIATDHGSGYLVILEQRFYKETSE